jgi:hypothetical protein
MASWWANKTRQAAHHVRAKVSAAERAGLVDWLRPAELALFDRMHVADRRHGLDVVATLRAAGETDGDVLLAGLLHDAGKGDTGLVTRVLYSLSQRYGDWIAAAARAWPWTRDATARLLAHAELSAALAREAGCPERTVELIRWQDEPHDPVAGERLRLADEAN